MLGDIASFCVHLARNSPGGAIIGAFCVKRRGKAFAKLAKAHMAEPEPEERRGQWALTVPDACIAARRPGCQAFH